MIVALSAALVLGLGVVGTAYILADNERKRKTTSATNR